MNYSNPRTEATFNDWPFGRTLKCQCTFKVELVPKKGERVYRTTVDPRNGRVSAPKRTTYGRKMKIVDGDDGRTYILEAVHIYGWLQLWKSDLMHNHEIIRPEDPRFAEVQTLLQD